MHRHSTNGFTLLEVIVAFVILAIVAAATVPAFLRNPELVDMDEAQGRIEALFRMARDSAVATAAEVTVSVDSASGLVWFDTRTRLSAQLFPAAESEVAASGGGNFPLRGGGSFGGGSTLGSGVGGVPGGARQPVNGEALDLPATVRMELFRARATFTFSPSGAATGDSILLRGAAGQVRLITPDPWSGRARVR